MNRYQRIVLGVGLLLVILNGLFPPYGVDARSIFSLSQEHYGYRFLFAPRVEYAYDSRGRIYSLANHVEH